MRKCLRSLKPIDCLVFFLLLPVFLSAQPYWNEWINFQQQYFKIPVVQNGIYRLDYAQISGAGINPATIDIRNFQLFYRGTEQYVYVKDQNKNNLLDSADYIEFYGMKNDGSLDSTLYKGVLYDQPVRQPNPYYSLFNDTSVYFLTWNTSLANRRIADSLETDYTLPVSPYFLKEILQENHQHYYYGQTTAYNINFPDYNEAEGWSDNPFGACGDCASSSYSLVLKTPDVYAGGPNAQAKLAVTGESNDPYALLNHHLTISYKGSGNYVMLDTFRLFGYRLHDSTYSLPASTLGASTEFLFVSTLVPGTSVSSNTVPYALIRYPHVPDLEKQKYFELYVPENASGPKSHYSFTNFLAAAPSYVYDLTNHLKIPVTYTASAWHAVIPNSPGGQEKFCVISSEDQFLTPAYVRPVNGTGNFINYAALAADSAFLIVTHKSLLSGASDYKSYRESAAGGSRHVLVADIDDLYDQFAYGIQKHPFSIRHFADYCADFFPTPPQCIFLMGKSIAEEKHRNQYNPSYWGDYLVNYAGSLVPSIGYPTCDNMLVAALNGNLIAPVVPIGRLAAKSNADVETYLNKLEEYEHPLPDPDEWMKQVIHLAGGKTAADVVQFGGYLDAYKAVITDTSFGGYVSTFKKFSSSPTQTSYTDSISHLIKNGISLLTFFGHSSASVFEFNLLPPDQYENTSGKYPFLLAAGCVAGDIHEPEISGLTSSEMYVLNKKGMIGFLASSGPGTAGDLNIFALQFYKEIGQLMYGRPVGKSIQLAIDSIEGNANDPYRTAACLEMTLHGDPSVVIHSTRLPDYQVSPSSVYFTPSYVSTDLGSFQMHVIVTNIGRAVHQKVPVSVKRIFADGTFVQYTDTLRNVFYKDTLAITLPVDPVHGAGLNKFEVHILHDNAELSYLNNDVSAPDEVPLMIYSGDIIPVYPRKYAIVPQNTLNLKAYTANPFSKTARYVFEIDTTDLFNSPLKKVQYVTQSGGVVNALSGKWLPAPLTLADSLVYFWRVRRDTTDYVNFRWRESSFQYIPQKQGWGQSHFFQFLKGDQFDYIDTLRAPRRFDLRRQIYGIEVSSANQAIKNLPIYLSIDGTKYYDGAFTSPDTPSVIIVVIDGNTGALMPNGGFGQYGSHWVYPSTSTGPGDEGFEFPTGTPAQQENLRHFIQDIIPCGNKVALFTFGNHNLGTLVGGNNPATVNLGLVNAFQSIGGTQFGAIQNNYPYILIGRKCGTGVEALGDSMKAYITVRDSAIYKRQNGLILSETVGPATKWESLHWKYRSSTSAKATISLDLIGIKTNGSADTLLKGIPKDSLDILNLGQTISADTFPYLKLQAFVADSSRLPPQLTYWRIYYDGVPEAALNPARHFSFYSPSIQQGDSVSLSVAIQNIGDYNMDSLWVDFWTVDANRNKSSLKSIKLDSLRKDSALVAAVRLSTDNLPAGLSSLWVEANPFNSHHQREEYHFNNIGSLPFALNADKTNPILDVTFDGVHIMNGDLVSAKPVIFIKLKDENKFLALNDTSAFQVFLKHPSGSTYERISFGKDMSFYPATLPENSCRIQYNPILPDGVYNLQVQAKDRSGNASGNTEYKISFEVINKPTVTSVLNYPNPFSTSTRFVFTLTGSQVPDYFKIQILTITGKIVREINKYELGPLHIGRNITDYAWDGKDEFGDQLANGLYLYRVLTQLDGKSLEHRDTGTDSFFKQGYGKMYLIR